MPQTRLKWGVRDCFSSRLEYIFPDIFCPRNTGNGVAVGPSCILSFRRDLVFPFDLSFLIYIGHDMPVNTTLFSVIFLPTMTYQIASSYQHLYYNHWQSTVLASTYVVVCTNNITYFWENLSIFYHESFHAHSCLIHPHTFLSLPVVHRSISLIGKRAQGLVIRV